MKIYTQQSITTNFGLKNNLQNPNFKAVSPVVLKRVQTAANNNASKDAFVKLASVIGLTALVAWVKSLSKTDAEAIKKLDIIDSNWTQKGNELFFDPQKQGQYMDLISKSDSAESLIWTKGLLSKVSADVESKEISSDEMEIFLDSESNETYLSVSADKTLNTIANQIKALSSAGEDVRTQTMKQIEAKLSALVKQANELQNSDVTAEIYAKVANILKMFAITNSISAVDQEPVDDKPKVSMVPEITGDVDYSAKDQVSVPAPVVLGKIELPVETPKGAAKNVEVKPVELPKLKPINITDENKEFVEDIFLKIFSKRSNIQPEVYADQIDFIQKIYETYVDDDKELIAKNLIKHLSRQNTVKEINMYKTYTGGEIGKVDFRQFLTLQTFKHINGGDISQEEFDFLETNKDNVFKYFILKEDAEKLVLAFCNGVSAKDKLKFAADFHKVAYNMTDSKLIKGDEYSIATSLDIKEELKNKLSRDASDYERILEYLDISEETMEAVAAEVEDGNFEEARILIGSALNSKALDEKINGLVNVINNPVFKDFIGGVHGRMRFIERILFSRQTNLTKTPYQMKQITSKLVEELKEQIEYASNIDLTNYTVRNSSGTSVHKYAPQIKIKGKTIGLNDRAEIHTIY